MTHMRTTSLALVLAFVACQSPSPSPQSATGSVKSAAPAVINGADAQALVAKGALLLDVRTPEEYEQLHLDGARNVPLATLSDSLAQLPKDKPIVVYCAAGARSAKAAVLLAEKGYDVRNLGAMENWKK